MGEFCRRFNRAFRTVENVTMIALFPADMISFTLCVLPLVPANVANLTGSTIQNDRIVVGKKQYSHIRLLLLLGLVLFLSSWGHRQVFLGQCLPIIKA